MQNFTAQIAVQLTEVFSPFMNSFRSVEGLDSLLNEFGWDTTSDDNIINTLETVLQILPLIDQTKVLIEQFNDDNSDVIKTATDLFEIIDDVYNLINGLNASSFGSLASPFNKNEFWNQLGDELIPFLVIIYFEQKLPEIYAPLYTIGVFDKTLIEFNPPDNERIPYLKHAIHWERLFEFIVKPIDLFKEVYSWDHGSDLFDYRRLNESIILLSYSFGFIARLEEPKGSFMDLYFADNNHYRRDVQQLEIPFYFNSSSDWSELFQLGLTLTPIPATDEMGPPVGLALASLVTGDLGTQNLNTSGEDGVFFKGGFDSEGLFSLDIRPNDINLALNGATDISAEIGIKSKPPSPIILIGDANATRLEMDGYLLSVGIEGKPENPEILFKVGTDDIGGNNKLRFVLDSGDGDGFISKIVGEDGAELEFGTSFLWSSKSGITFNGEASFEFDIIAHIDLIFLQITQFSFSAKASNDSGISITTAISLKSELGPFQLAIQDIGAQLLLSSEQPNKGFAGLEPTMKFKPPNGIGIQVDASAIKGGGFLFIDVDKGEYAGVVELTIQGTISLKAIGIINTKLPNGENGFAMLLLITAEFTPVQLGFGFTLNGVGGLIGINRGMNLTAIREGVRNDTLDHILFPDDPVANAPAIIANLNSVFPIAEGNHSFGIMGIIGWGTPTLLEVELGVMITFPSFDLAVIGKLSTSLPDKNAAILTLNVAFAGTMSFEKKYFYFDAAIFDSKLLTFSLSGQMALRILWGDEPNFVLSVGGFHPDFVPPPLELNDLERITLNLLADDNPRLTLKTYFAVTSNSVQFGASIDFLFKFSKFKVVGYLYFHALFQFDPFYFKISIGAGLDVKIGSSTILSVSVSGSLEGPTPWKIKGKGKFKILFISFSVSFSETWGETRDTSLPGVQVYPKLKEAILDNRNWNALLPKNSTLTTLRAIPEEDLVSSFTIHPFGSLSILQRVVPLKETIDLFGNQEPSDYKRFELSLSIDGNGVASSEKKDFFAPAQFFNLSDAQKISKDAYVKYRAGLAANTTEALAANHHVNRVVEYELEVLDTKDNPPMRGVYIQTANQMAHWAKGTAIAKSELGLKAEQQILESGKNILLQEETFVIVNQSDLSQLSNISVGTELELQKMLDEIILEDPEMESELMVVSSYEIL